MKILQGKISSLNYVFDSSCFHCYDFKVEAWRFQDKTCKLYCPGVGSGVLLYWYVRLCMKLFETAMSDTDHKLHHLLLPKHVS